jgi:MFS family permease
MSSALVDSKRGANRDAAMKLVVLFGIVSLLSDMTYEGARSVTGPFLATLGASGTVVGLVAGLGEFIGYGLRIVSGYVSDRTGQYWLMTGLGYAFNLLAVPLLAVAGNWQLAAALMIAERTGKAIRKPARDTMLSYATSQVGHGWGFAVHEAMDQIGAVIGPLLMALALSAGGGYRSAFRILLVPALLTLGVLVVARVLYPKPRDLEAKTTVIESKGLPQRFWVYILSIGLVAAGYADFPLIAFHLKQTAAIPDTWVPLLYAGAMGIDAVAALFFGWLFDRIKVGSLIWAVSVSAFFAPFAFLGGIHAAYVGIALWGIGMGAQESILKSAIADMVIPERRGSAYGIFNASYGLFWFAGSALMGVLYDVSIPLLVCFSVAAQVVSVVALAAVNRGAARSCGESAQNHLP